VGKWRGAPGVDGFRLVPVNGLIIKILD